MPHSELNQPRPMSSDPRLNRNLTLPKFICAFNKYRNIMCEVWNRRQEIDAYEAVIVGIASWIEGTAFYEYHRSFSARAAALIKKQNVKVDWAVRDNGLFAVCRPKGKCMFPVWQRGTFEQFLSSPGKSKIVQPTIFQRQRFR